MGNKIGRLMMFCVSQRKKAVLHWCVCVCVCNTYQSVYYVSSFDIANKTCNTPYGFVCLLAINSSTSFVCNTNIRKWMVRFFFLAQHLECSILLKSSLRVCMFMFVCVCFLNVLQWNVEYTIAYLGAQIQKWVQTNYDRLLNHCCP